MPPRPALWANAEDAEDVVVARGSVVASHVRHGELIQAGDGAGAQVEPAALAEPGAAAAAGRAADCHVVGDCAAADLQARLAVVVDAAAETVAAAGTRGPGTA